MFAPHYTCGFRGQRNAYQEKEIEMEIETENDKKERKREAKRERRILLIPLMQTSYIHTHTEHPACNSSS